MTCLRSTGRTQGRPISPARYSARTRTGRCTGPRFWLELSPVTYPWIGAVASCSGRKGWIFGVPILDGSGIEVLVPRVRGGGISDIALDLGAGKVYWLSYATRSIAGRIQRANLDGSGIEDLATGLGGIRNLTLDLIGGKMYWTDDESDGQFRIRRANLDGSGVQDVVMSLTHPRNLALNPGAGKIYWTEHETPSSDAVDGKIQRANLDGSAIQDLVTGLARPELIALDLNAGIMYWTEVGEFWTDRDGKISARATGWIRRRGTRYGFGSDRPCPGAECRQDLLVGPRERRTDHDGKIQRANLDGTGVEDLVTGLGHPNFIAMDISDQIGNGDYGNTEVSIPDANLRAVIEDSLGKRAAHPSRVRRWRR